MQPNDMEKGEPFSISLELVSDLMDKLEMIVVNRETIRFFSNSWVRVELVIKRYEEVY